MKTIAWYDPSNGVVSTDRDCPLFTPLGQLWPLYLERTEQEPVAWPCLIDSADFSANTITLVMQCEDYKVSAGTHWLSTTPPKGTK